MNYGWLVYNESLKNEKFDALHDLYKKSATNHGIKLDLVSNKEIIPLVLTNKTEIFCGFDKPDFVLFLDKDITLAETLQNAGFRVLNTPSAIKVCDSKIDTLRCVSSHNIKIPKTINAPLDFVFNTCEYFENFIEKEFSYPFVIKETFGSFGEQVYLIKNRENFIDIKQKIGTKPHIYQEYINSSFGRDVRIYVIFGRAVLSVLRKNDADFRANLAIGGSMELFEPHKSFIDMAEKCADIIGADFCGIDILFGENDEPILCEINSNAHIKGVFDLTAINIADFIFKGIKKDETV